MPNPTNPSYAASLLVVLLAAACGGSVVDTGPVVDGGARRESGRGGSERDQQSERPLVVDAAPNDDFPVYLEDACPDAPPQASSIACDPFVQSSCPAGRACYPIPPRATDRCHPGSYSTLCLPGGFGLQGAPCGDGTDCAGGFICVKSGAGDQCVKLCHTNQLGACTDGRVCREVDVTGSGWGGCE